MPVMPRPKKAVKLAKRALKTSDTKDMGKNYARTVNGDPKLEKEIRKMIKR